VKPQPAAVLNRVESPEPGSEAERRVIREAVADAERGVLVHPFAIRHVH